MRLKALGLYKWILLKWKFPPIPEMEPSSMARSGEGCSNRGHRLGQKPQANPSLPQHPPSSSPQGPRRILTPFRSLHTVPLTSVCLTHPPPPHLQAASTPNSPHTSSSLPPPPLSPKTDPSNFPLLPFQPFTHLCSPSPLTYPLTLSPQLTPTPFTLHPPHPAFWNPLLLPTLSPSSPSSCHSI